jgi:hypothetical protein
VLADKPPAWRRVRVEFSQTPEEPVAIAPLLAYLPNVVSLRIAFDEYGNAAGTLDWEGARAPRLEQLVLVDVEGALERAELPALVELRLYGASAAASGLRASPLWSRLTRIVLDEANNTIADGEHAYRGSDHDWPDTAMIVVGGLLDAGRLTALADSLAGSPAGSPAGRSSGPGSLTGLDQLVLRTGMLRWHSTPLTVICMHGDGDVALAPYGFAVILHRELPTAPIALIDLRGDGRALVLADSPIRPEGGSYEQLVRDTLDVALGRDPGVAILHDLLDELDCAPDVIVRGERDSNALDVLFDIDPDNAPPSEPDDDDFFEEDRDPLDRRAPGELDEADIDYEYDDPPESYELSYDEPVEPDEPDDAEPDDEPDVVETPDGIDAWMRADDAGCDRELDPDDERYLQRWPDPEILFEEVPDIETFVGESTCAYCEAVAAISTARRAPSRTSTHT